MANDIDKRMAVEGRKLVYRNAGETVTVQAWGRDGLRVRVTPTGGRQTSDWALDIPLEASVQTVEIENPKPEPKPRKVSYGRSYGFPRGMGHT